MGSFSPRAQFAWQIASNCLLCGGRKQGRPRMLTIFRLKHLSIVLNIFLLSAAALAQTDPHIRRTLVNGIPSNIGHVGANLTIQGSGFGATEGFSLATLNGILLCGPGVGCTWSDTSIQAVIPNTAESGPIVVTVGNIESNRWHFGIIPVLLRVYPRTARAGKSVTINGDGLGTSGGTVTFNGQKAKWTGWTDASITATVPPAATAGPIVATVRGQTSNGVPFTPTAVITKLSPDSGKAGDQVTIKGYSFGDQQLDSSVTFDGVTASVISWSNKSIVVTAPSGAGTGYVVVTVNWVHSKGKLFTYISLN